MSTKDQAGAARGRPRSSDVSDAVYAAALEIVADGGLAKTSRSEIAAQAGVSRQTLYNRWETVGDIVLEALLVRGERELGRRDGGTSTAREQLADYVRGLARALNGWAAPGLRAVVAHAQQDPAFARRFRTRFLEPRHCMLLEVVSAACRSHQDPKRIAELIAASMWYRLLVAGLPLDRDWVNSMLVLVDE